MYTDTCGGQIYSNWSKWLRWDYQVDLTNYNTISFYARKNANHGTISVYVTSDGIQTRCTTDVLTSVGASYSTAPTSWTKYELDVSEITGVKTVSFMGGYGDYTGNTSSSTSYCNIRFQ